MPRSLVPLAGALLTGCYVYHPVSTAQPEVGTRVAAQLTGTASDTLAWIVGPGVTTVRGDVVGTGDSDVILSVTSVMDRSGREQSWTHEQLRLPRTAVQGFERRGFSLGRSVLLGAALIGGSVISWEAFRGGFRGGGILPGGSGGAPK